MTTDPATTSTADRRDRTITFAMSGAVFVAMVGVTTLVAAHRNGGHFTYPLDDVYIHLAIAKDLALHGTWGVVPGVYTSASSSPLWTILLALPIRVAPSLAPIFPMALAVLVGLGILWLASGVVTVRRVGSRLGAGAVLVVIMLAVGLVPLAVSGMEALLHGLLVSIALLWLIRAVDRDLSARQHIVLALILALAVLTRFETAFVGVGAVVALVVVPPAGGWDGSLLRGLWTRRRGALLAVALGVGVPIVAYGAINLGYGEYPVPNSVIAKSAPMYGLVGRYRHFKGWTDLLGRAMVDPELLLLVAVVAAIAFVAFRTGRRGLAAAGVAYLVVVVLHLLFDNVGVINVYFARYDTYLVVSGVVLVAVAAMEVNVPWRAMAAAALACVLLVAATPRVRLAITVPAQGHEIYRQQLQTARFLARFYDGKAVAVNDLGETALHHQGPLLDLTGLASFDILKAKRDGTYSADLLAHQVQADHVQVIAVYPSWFLGTQPEDPLGYVPTTWVPVEQWCLGEADFKVVGDRCVWFIAPDAAHVAVLQRNLNAFHASLPAGILVGAPGTPLPGLPLQPPPPT